MSDDIPHYTGHRARLRERFLSGGPDALPDYELLELLLFQADPRKDVKPLAKALLAHFGGFAEVISADPQRLADFPGLKNKGITEIKIVLAAARRLLRDTTRRTSISSGAALLDYCRATMAFEPREEFRVLFLDVKNNLIDDAVLGRGTVDHAPVYPREVAAHALKMGASSVILVHNHPSGDPKPSQADIDMTQAIVAALAPLDIAVHDHVVIGRHGHASFRSLGLLKC
jgi:DNA repair protein RadC